jgi:hypothetical protein
VSGITLSIKSSGCSPAIPKTLEHFSGSFLLS